MLLFHCHSSKIYLLIDGLKLENGILKEVGSNDSDVLKLVLMKAMFCLLIYHLIPLDTYMTRNPTESNFFIS